MEEQILIFRTSVKNVRDIKHIATLFTLCPQIYKCPVERNVQVEWRYGGLGKSVENRMSGNHPD